MQFHFPYHGLVDQLYLHLWLIGDNVWQGVAGEEPQEQQAGRPLLQQGQQQGQEKVKKGGKDFFPWPQNLISNGGGESVGGDSYRTLYNLVIFLARCKDYYDYCENFHENN